MLAAVTARLRIFQALPAGLCDVDATQLAELLGGPALIHVPGDAQPALFVSVLLHGNETSGWNALRRLLAHDQPLPRSLLMFIGNVHAAAQGLRMLASQQDFNRIWRGEVPGAEGELAASVARTIRGTALFAAVDLHNNTGHNPHYSVLTRLDASCRGLAYLFSNTAVYVEEPDTVLARLFDELCPVVTLELGPVNDAMCEERALDFLRRLLVLDAIPTEAALELFQSRARVHVRDDVGFSFAEDGRATPLVLTSGVEAVNFHALAVGTPFGRSTRPVTDVLKVLDAAHRDVTQAYFTQHNTVIALRRDVVPAMYTTDPLVVRQDCLCYFMEPLALPPNFR